VQTKKGFVRAKAGTQGIVCHDRWTKRDVDPNLYYKVENGCPLILVLYVDDMILIGDEKLIIGCK
jgi:hypothetical protein